MTITTGSISIGPLGLPAPWRANLDTLARDVAEAARLVRQASAPRRVKAKIDTAVIYARLNRPRAALPETRSGLCASTCDEERQGRDLCAGIQCARLLEPSKLDNVHARARRPRTFVQMVRDTYGGAA